MTVASMTETARHFCFLTAGPGEAHSKISPRPVISICLQRWRQSGSGMPIIGTYLKTARDVDLQINAMIADLEEIRMAAKLTLGAAEQRSTRPTDDHMEAAD